MGEEHGVQLEKEHTLPQDFQGLAEAQMCPTDGKGYQDVDIGGEGLAVFFLFVVNLDRLL